MLTIEEEQLLIGLAAIVDGHLQQHGAQAGWRGSTNTID